MASSIYSGAVRELFSKGDISRGERYFRSGRVMRFDSDGNRVSAAVKGSTRKPYAVSIVLQDGSIQSYKCSCPKYRDTGSCKHAWAVLRKLQSAQSSLNPPSDPAEDNQSNLPAGVRPRLPSTGTLVSNNGHQELLDAPKESPAWMPVLQAIQEAIVSRRGHSQPTAGSTSNWNLTYFLRIDRQGYDCPRIQVELNESSADEEELATNVDGGAGRGSIVGRSRRRGQRITCRQLHYQYRPEEFAHADQRIIHNLRAVASFQLHSVSGTAKRYGGYYAERHAASAFDQDTFAINSECSPFLLQEMVATGRLFWQLDRAVQPNPTPVKRWLADRLVPRLVFETVTTEQCLLKLELRSGEVSIRPPDIVWHWQDGHVLTTDSLGVLDESSLPWLTHFLRSGNQTFSLDQRDGLIEALLQVPDLPEVQWPEQWQVTEEVGVPDCVLRVSWPEHVHSSDNCLLKVTPIARYGNAEFVILREGKQVAWDSTQRKLVHRDAKAEWERLHELSAIPEIDQQIYPWRVHWNAISALQDALQRCGWSLEVEGRPLIAHGAFSFEVTSGVDWFDLSGGVAYQDQIVPIPVLLQAAKRREQYITLSDGSRGMLPSQWIERFGKFLELAEIDGDAIRFTRPQAMLLDCLLREQDEARSVRFDADFRSMRRKLSQFNGVKPAQPPKSFQGELRDYQREGLGWFNFLREFGFGGCLADDMGLGKTVQVLALLEQRRRRRPSPDAPKKPSLIVVPKSLIFNWIDEANRFAPKLNVVNYTGVGRSELVNRFCTADVILTTYGILRQDIERLASIAFDYAILDEAQAIKNSQTAAAKASYVINADHRLTMTGTPVENHLGDLWSQFRFLNPGLLGHSQAFSAFSRSDCDESSLGQLSAAVRPFILRRTKQEVLKELPEKSEQTLICEMSPKQARQYNELKDHYRTKLAETVERLGIKRSKIHVLEALLRLRQTACDGRLVNSRKGAPGAKLQMLMEQLEEVLSEGHKVLVFSQFTSLLDLLRKELLKKKLRFEYLDGRTTDRKSPVARFQNDQQMQLFLISLKAGGHGLNLTAADYVYILDPWWNPAVEAQAIDRAHRIGQTKRVFAYRMITRDTVEEKIVQLQQSKRELADAIISGSNSLIRTLTADDLKMLLE
jgi:superfamily II DNA or RNA helicase